MRINDAGSILPEAGERDKEEKVMIRAPLRAVTLDAALPVAGGANRLLRERLGRELNKKQLGDIFIFSDPSLLDVLEF